MSGVFANIKSRVNAFFTKVRNKIADLGLFKRKASRGAGSLRRSGNAGDVEKVTVKKKSLFKRGVKHESKAERVKREAEMSKKMESANTICDRINTGKEWARDRMELGKLMKETWTLMMKDKSGSRFSRKASKFQETGVAILNLGFKHGSSDDVRLVMAQLLSCGKDFPRGVRSDIDGIAGSLAGRDDVKLDEVTEMLSGMKEGLNTKERKQALEAVQVYLYSNKHVEPREASGVMDLLDEIGGDWKLKNEVKMVFKNLAENRVFREVTKDKQLDALVGETRDRMTTMSNKLKWIAKDAECMKALKGAQPLKKSAVVKFAKELEGLKEVDEDTAWKVKYMLDELAWTKDKELLKLRGMISKSWVKKLPVTEEGFKKMDAEVRRSLMGSIVRYTYQEPIESASVLSRVVSALLAQPEGEASEEFAQYKRELLGDILDVMSDERASLFAKVEKGMRHYEIGDARVEDPIKAFDSNAMLFDDIVGNAAALGLGDRVIRNMGKLLDNIYPVRGVEAAVVKWAKKELGNMELKKNSAGEEEPVQRMHMRKMDIVDRLMKTDLMRTEGRGKELKQYVIGHLKTMILNSNGDVPFGVKEDAMVHLMTLAREDWARGDAEVIKDVCAVGKLGIFKQESYDNGGERYIALLNLISTNMAGYCSSKGVAAEVNRLGMQLRQSAIDIMLDEKGISQNDRELFIILASEFVPRVGEGVKAEELAKQNKQMRKFMEEVLATKRLRGLGLNPLQMGVLKALAKYSSEGNLDSSGELLRYGPVREMTEWAQEVVASRVRIEMSKTGYPDRMTLMLFEQLQGISGEWANKAIVGEASRASSLELLQEFASNCIARMKIKGPEPPYPVRVNTNAKIMDRQESETLIRVMWALKEGDVEGALEASGRKVLREDVVDKRADPKGKEEEKPVEEGKVMSAAVTVRSEAMVAVKSGDRELMERELMSTTWFAGLRDMVELFGDDDVDAKELAKVEGRLRLEILNHIENDKELGLKGLYLLKVGQIGVDAGRIVNDTFKKSLQEMKAYLLKQASEMGDEKVEAFVKTWVETPEDIPMSREVLDILKGRRS